MPNVTIFAGEETLSKPADVHEGFLRECTDLCTGTMRAELDKVHIIFVRTESLHVGRPAYIEIKLREGGHRTPALMGEFMASLEDAFVRSFGSAPRIRCFAYSADHIFARN